MERRLSMKADFLIQSQADDLSLFARHWPADNPRAVMSLIHGFGEHSGRYEPMAKHLNAHNIAVLSMDLRGHGLTEGARGIVKSYEHMIGDIDALLDESQRLYPSAPQYLYGHSMGGGLALHYGLNRDRDLSGYLISGPLIRPGDPVPGLLRSFVKTIKPLFPNSTLRVKFTGEQISTQLKTQTSYFDDPLNHDRLGGELAVGMLEAGEDTLRHAKNWNKPLRLWHARKDRLTSFKASEEFASKAQNCQFTVFEDVAHEMHNDTSREAVYALMLEFMETPQS